MLGLMQNWPLTVDRIIDHASRRHGAREVVWRGSNGSFLRSTYTHIERRARQVSHGLVELGIGPGDRVGTLAWNSAPHVETWYGAMGLGAVCHPLNPRFHPKQLGWIISHAEDRVIFVAPDLLDPLSAALATVNLPPPEIIVLEDDATAWPMKPAKRSYEEWLSRRSTRLEDAPAWGNFPEESACGLCYTSGTTGDPKGVLYSHRSNFLHTFITLQSDVFGLTASDVVLPLVPMFHANAWGLVFSAPAVGAKLVLPGRQLDPAAIHDVIIGEGVTFAAGVPTVWQALLEYLRDTGKSLGTLQRIVVGGSVCSEQMIRKFHDMYGVEVRHAWGMTEVSPLGTTSTPPARLANLPFEERIGALMKQGRPPLGVEMAIVDDHGEAVPEDGHRPGRLIVRGPAVARSYFRSDATIVDDSGFFDTGDIATIDGEGVMRITDRAKDVIKSGGEWISSIAIEEVALAHSGVRQAAVIAIPDELWGERPLLIIEPRAGIETLSEELIDLLLRKLPKWWMPTIRVVDSIPLGATGKVDKRSLRAQFCHLT